MALVDRARNILLNPASEWPVIAAEPATPASLLTGYALPLLLITPVMMLVGALLLSSFVGGLLGHLGIGAGVGAGVGVGIALSTFVYSLVTVVALAFLVSALAPSFGGEQNAVQAFKLVVYASTASWLSGVLLLVPFLGWMLMFLLSIYSYYTFYLGLPVLMKCPKERTAGYFLVTVLGWIVLVWISRRMAFGGLFHL
jgi:hypothetical protein